MRTFGRKWRKFTGGGSGILGRPVSRVVAPSLGLGAGLTLWTKPLANGDSWLKRAQESVVAASQGDYSNPLNFDSYGNNTLSIASDQIVQNAPTAIGLGIGAALVRGLGTFFGA